MESQQVTFHQRSHSLVCPPSPAVLTTCCVSAGRLGGGTTNGLTLGLGQGGKPGKTGRVTTAIPKYFISSRLKPPKQLNFTCIWKFDCRGSQSLG